MTSGSADSPRLPVTVILGSCLFLIGASAASIGPYRAIAAIDQLHLSTSVYALVMTLGIHIWRVRKDGFAVRRSNVGAFEVDAVAQPAAAAPAHAAPELYGGRVRLLGVVDRESITAEARPVDDTVFTWPHLVVRHVVVALGTAAVVLALGVAFSAPLRGLANPNVTPEPAKAPWYFAGLQELLSRFDPLVAGILIPAAAVMAFVLLPYLDRNPATEARNRKVAVTLFSILLTLAVVLTVVGTFFRGPGWQWIPPWDHWYVEL